MKVALVQDWFVVNGGAEKVVREIIALYPNCEVFCLIDFLNDEDREFILHGKKTNASFLQHIPFIRKNYRSFLPLFSKAIESLDLSRFDIIISSSYAVAKGVKKTSNQKHICYCHSPIKYAWDSQDEFIKHLPFIKRTGAKFVLNKIRKWDINNLHRVDLFIANSNYIAEKIKRIYNREAIVIYPPVDINSFLPHVNKKEYYFTSARLVPYKKIDLLIETFNQLPHLKLIISGDGPERERLIKLANKNIKFAGHLAKNDLIKHMQEAKAFIVNANEDFGITSIEAQCCLTPVIAYRKGGYIETVKEGETGEFFEEQSINSLKKAVLQFEETKKSYIKADFSLNTKRFSIERFHKEFTINTKKYFEESYN